LTVQTVVKLNGVEQIAYKKISNTDNDNGEYGF